MHNVMLKHLMLNMLGKGHQYRNYGLRSCESLIRAMTCMRAMRIDNQIEDDSTATGTALIPDSIL